MKSPFSSIVSARAHPEGEQMLWPLNLMVRYAVTQMSARGISVSSELEEGVR